MVRIESDHLLIFCGNRYRERLSALVCKVYLLSNFQFLGTWQFSDLQFQNGVRIRHAVSFLRHQVNLFHLAYFHISDSGIEAGHAIAEAMLEARAQSADDTAESRSPGTTRATGSTPAIDGIFCINDYAAFGVIRGLADYGIRVPDDVRVIGFDGATAGSYTTPTLSTVQVDLDQLAQFALDMITRRVEQRDQGDGRSDESAGMPATRATIGYTLVPRESTVGSANR